MLEHENDQAMGLQRHAMASQARLVAIVLQGGAQTQLAMYWTLCKVWSDQGHRVVVLDGSTRENHRAPGLAQVLDGDEYLHHAVLRASQNLQILAAAQGLEELAQQALRPGFRLASQLATIYSHYDIVVLMALPDVMGALLRGTDTVPMVSAGSGDDQEILDSYTAIKQMVSRGGLRAAMLAINEPETPQSAEQAAQAGMRIRDCAQHFLDCTVEIELVGRQHTLVGAPMNVFHLASRTLGRASDPDTEFHNHGSQGKAPEPAVQ
jgi:hypothetical protein